MARPKLTRAVAEASLEFTAEVSIVAEAPAEGDLYQGALAAIRAPELLLAGIESLRPDVLTERQWLPTERLVQIALGAFECRRDLVDGQVRLAQMICA